jgi:hypothetical protein
VLCASAGGGMISLIIIARDSAARGSRVTRHVALPGRIRTMGTLTSVWAGRRSRPISSFSSLKRCRGRVWSRLTSHRTGIPRMLAQERTEHGARSARAVGCLHWWMVGHARRRSKCWDLHSQCRPPRRSVQNKCRRAPALDVQTTPA